MRTIVDSERQYRVSLLWERIGRLQRFAHATVKRSIHRFRACQTCCSSLPHRTAVLADIMIVTVIIISTAFALCFSTAEHACSTKKDCNWMQQANTCMCESVSLLVAYHVFQLDMPFSCSPGHCTWLHRQRYWWRPLVHRNISRHCRLLYLWLRLLR